MYILKEASIQNIHFDISFQVNRNTFLVTEVFLKCKYFLKKIILFLFIAILKDC